jgi:hypothetical protein
MEPEPPDTPSDDATNEGGQPNATMAKDRALKEATDPGTGRTGGVGVDP